MSKGKLGYNIISISEMTETHQGKGAIACDYLAVFGLQILRL